MQGKLACLDARHDRGGLIPTHAGKTTRATTTPHQTKAHPHSRGENLPMRITIVLPGGSSPLTRGKLHLAALTGADARLIPAHAGKTFRALARVKRLRAHPHSRGENAPGIASPSWFQGSSPLARGKQCQHEIEGHQAGLIPTHVGKTNSCAGSTGRTWVHPRPRGENLWRAFRKGMAWGSSPLTRGKHSGPSHG